jgi:hypothetical protein
MRRRLWTAVDGLTGGRTVVRAPASPAARPLVVLLILGLLLRSVVAPLVLIAMAVRAAVPGGPQPTDGIAAGPLPTPARR